MLWVVGAAERGWSEYLSRCQRPPVLQQQAIPKARSLAPPRVALAASSKIVAVVIKGAAKAASHHSSGAYLRNQDQKHSQTSLHEPTEQNTQRVSPSTPLLALSCPVFIHVATFFSYFGSQSIRASTFGPALTTSATLEPTPFTREVDSGKRDDDIVPCRRGTVGPWPRRRSLTIDATRALCATCGAFVQRKARGGPGNAKEVRSRPAKSLRGSLNGSTLPPSNPVRRQYADRLG